MKRKHNEMPELFKNAQWIWLEKDVNKVNQYACFRREFELEKRNFSKTFHPRMTYGN